MEAGEATLPLFCCPVPISNEVNLSGMVDSEQAMNEMQSVIAAIRVDDFLFEDVHFEARLLAIDRL